MANKLQVYIEDGWYGYLTPTNDGEADFDPIGRVPNLEEITIDLKSKRSTLKLSDVKHGQKTFALLDRGSLYSGRGLDELAAQGFDVRQGHGAAFIEAIRLLVEEQEEAGITPTISFDGLGWYPRFKITDTGQEIELLFQANELIGTNEKSRYEGVYDVAPIGDYEEWRKMVLDDVLPHIGLQVVLVAALSSVIIGLLGLHREILRPIYHLHLPSGLGKTTAAAMASSTLTSTKNSSVPSVNAMGQTVYKQAGVASWAATSNALIGAQRGNFGAVVILNELGTCLEKDLSSCCYLLSQGSEKVRMSSDLKVRANEGYACVFLSNGEHSLLSRCRSKAEGLALRILEMDTPLTASADHANRIANACNNNHGFAAPMLAEHIIRKGGYAPLNDRYEVLCHELREHFTTAKSTERFIETFVAPCILTVELASEALNIPFERDRILQFFVDYEAKHGEDRATSKKSYEELLQEFAINHDRFVYRDDTVPTKKTLKKKVPSIMPSGKFWGRITKKNVTMDDGRVLIREYEVYPTFVEKILKQYGHDSLKSCQDAWIEMGVYSFDDDKHRSRKRQMTEGSTRKDRVFVFLEFEEPDDDSKTLDAPSTPEGGQEPNITDGNDTLDTPSAPEGGQEPNTAESRMAYLLQDDNDDDFDDFSYLEEDEDVA